jgi:hypothetical protein
VSGGHLAIIVCCVYPKKMQERFESQYAAACAELGVQPLQAVVAAAVGLSTDTYILRNVSLGAKGTEALSAALRGVAVETLAVCHCYIGDDGCACLMETVQQNEALRRLTLSGNGLRDAAALSAALPLSGKLVSLELEWNKLGADAGQLAQLLSRIAAMPELTYAGLRNNMVGAPCTEAICRLLSDSRSLTHIELSWNALGAGQGPLLGNALSANNTLVSLSTSGNGFARLDVEAIEQRLRTNERSAWAVEQAHVVEASLRSELATALEINAAAGAKLDEAVAGGDALAARVAVAQADADAMRRSHSDALALCESSAKARELAATAAEETAATARRNAANAAEEATGRVVEACKMLDECRVAHAQAETSWQKQLSEHRDAAHIAAAAAVKMKAEHDAEASARSRLNEDAKAAAVRTCELEATIQELRTQVIIAEDTASRHNAATAAKDAELDDVRQKMSQLKAAEASHQAKLTAAAADHEAAIRDLGRAAHAVEQQHARERDDHEGELRRATRQLEDAHHKAEHDCGALTAELDAARKKLTEAAAATDEQHRAHEGRCTALQLEARRLNDTVATAVASAQRADIGREKADQRAAGLSDELNREARRHADVVQQLSDDLASRNEADASALERCATLEASLASAEKHASHAEKRHKQQQATLEKRLVAAMKAMSSVAADEQ